MRLASLTEFRQLVYTPDSAPDLRTLRSRIRRGEIAGGRIEDTRFYVDLDEYDRVHRVRDAIAARRSELVQDPLLNGLV